MNTNVQPRNSLIIVYILGSLSSKAKFIVSLIWKEYSQGPLLPVSPKRIAKRFPSSLKLQGSRKVHN